MRTFYTWAREQAGAKMNKIDIKIVDGVRGIFAEEHIEAGEELLNVSAKAILGCKEDNVIRKWFTPEMTSAFSEDILCTAILLLMETHNDSSWFKPWLKTLPTADDMKDVPWYWTHDELEYLQDAGTAQAVLSLDASLKETYENLIIPRTKEAPPVKVSKSEPAFPRGEYTIDELKWAVIMAISRTWSFGMVPLVDLGNHHFEKGRLISIEYEINGNMESPITTLGLHAGSSMEPGEQFYVQYGDKTGLHLLTYYGFLPPLEEDSISVHMYHYVPSERAPGSDEDIVVTLLDNRFPDVHGETREMNFNLHHERGIPADMLDFARIVSFRACSDSAAVASPDGSWIMHGPISYANEIRALKMIYDIVVGEPSPTTIEEDEALLESSDLSRVVRIAVRCRLQAKLLRREALQLLEAKWLALLSVEHEANFSNNMGEHEHEDHGNEEAWTEGDEHSSEEGEAEGHQEEGAEYEPEPEVEAEGEGES